MSKALNRYSTYARMPWDPARADFIRRNADHIRPFRTCHASLVHSGGYIMLVSYNTPVAIANMAGALVMLDTTYYSNTTTRQVRWFLQDYCGINNP